MDAPKVKMRCPICSGYNVNCSAIVMWDFASQAWQIQGTPLDDDFCEDCEEEIRMVSEVVIEPSLAPDPQSNN